MCRSQEKTGSGQEDYLIFLFSSSPGNDVSGYATAIMWEVILVLSYFFHKKQEKFLLNEFQILLLG
jgi:hypothetical protein